MVVLHGTLAGPPKTRTHAHTPRRALEPANIGVDLVSMGLQITCTTGVAPDAEVVLGGM